MEFVSPTSYTNLIISKYTIIHKKTKTKKNKVIPPASFFKRLRGIKMAISTVVVTKSSFLPHLKNLLLFST